VRGIETAVPFTDQQTPGQPEDVVVPLEKEQEAHQHWAF
jgi:hypothetical protein